MKAPLAAALLACALTGGAAAAAAPAPAAALSAPGRGAPGAFHKSSDAIAARLVRASAGLLGVPYQEGPLGEGPDGLYDSLPLMRLDHVDCVTFVEESLAIARARDQAGMLSELLKIRYRGGVVSYQTRNHFTEADWLPNNAAAGFITDITERVAGRDTRWASKTVSKRAWYAAKTVKDLQGPRAASLSDAQKRALVARWRALGAAMPDQTVTLPYLPMAALAAHAADIPSGTIVSLVRADQPDKPTMISHMGLIVQKDGRTWFRHAHYGDKVIDAPVPDYFRIYQGSSWPLLGLNLAAPLEPR